MSDEHTHQILNTSGPLPHAQYGLIFPDADEEPKVEELKHTGPKPEEVYHPPHYTSHPSGIECIEVTRHMNFNLGNAIKYIWRSDLKGNDIVDLQKAVWYINDEIERRSLINQAASEQANTGDGATRPT